MKSNPKDNTNASYTDPMKQEVVIKSCAVRYLKCSICQRWTRMNCMDTDGVSTVMWPADADARVSGGRSLPRKISSADTSC